MRSGLAGREQESSLDDYRNGTRSVGITKWLFHKMVIRASVNVGVRRTKKKTAREAVILNELSAFYQGATAESGVSPRSPARGYGLSALTIAMIVVMNPTPVAITGK